MTDLLIAKHKMSEEDIKRASLRQRDSCKRMENGTDILYEYSFTLMV